MAYDIAKEINEAIRAGEQALRSLNEANDYLSSARNWGVVDILGGGLLTNLIKHSKVHDASRCMENAKRDLQTFSRELDDVDEYIPDVKVGDFLVFADFFFDGFLADVIVQSKIGEARQQVNQAIYQVTSIVNRLKKEV